MTTATRLCLIRHGETDWNRERRLQGQLDIPLNASGQHQARQTAVRLAELAEHTPFAALYSSDLARARDTASTAASRLQLEVVPAAALRERHFGQLQGLTPEEARVQLPHLQLAMRHRELDNALDGGETLLALASRLRHFLGHMLERHTGQTVLAVTHGGALDVIYRMAVGRPLDGVRDFALPNAALNWIAHDEQGWKLESWADTDHLDPALDENFDQHAG
jgi:probable phosphoglycerate mutase